MITKNNISTFLVGPCETDMNRSIAEYSFSSSVRETFQAQKERGELLSCHESIAKLMKILLDDTYDNAAVIDFYDY